ncbi:hypothetical protein Hanom_Chr09g00814061 [Helianthus anomalus]
MITRKVLGYNGIKNSITNSLDECRAPGHCPFFLTGHQYHYSFVVSLFKCRVPTLQYLVCILERISFTLQTPCSSSNKYFIPLFSLHIYRILYLLQKQSLFIKIERALYEHAVADQGVFWGFPGTPLV